MLTCVRSRRWTEKSTHTVDRSATLNEYLQSVSNPLVYAAGDATSLGPPLTPVSGHDGKISRISGTGQSGVAPLEHCATVSARMDSSLTRSESLLRTLARCALAILCTSAHEARAGPPKASKARISSRVNPRSRERRMKANVRFSAGPYTRRPLAVRG